MVRIDRVVTRGGDGGETSLGDGSRVRKDNVRTCAYGTLDEANAVIGLLRIHIIDDITATATILRIQNDLFDIGADLCVPGTAVDRFRLSDVPCDKLETEIEAMNAELAPLNSFVLPGGTAAAAYAHLARTVVRRAERSIVTLSKSEAVNMAVLRYLNRLSDYFFVLARRLNENGHSDVEWTPGESR